MQFPYETYFRNEFIIPLIFLGITLLLLIYKIVSLIKIFRKKSKPNHLLGPCVGFAIIFLLTLYFAFPLSRGVPLAGEKETDAVQTQGTVQKTATVFFAGKYYVEDHVTWMSYLIIDGEKYFCMTGAYVKAGDKVEIKYLPKSKIILEMNKSETAPGDVLEPQNAPIALIVLLSLIFSASVCIIAIIIACSILIRRAIKTKNFTAARRFAVFYRAFLFNLKRQKMSLLIALLSLLAGNIEKADKNFSTVKDVRLDAAKKFWRVIEGYLCNNPSPEALLSEFAFADKTKTKGIPTYAFYRSCLEKIDLYRKTQSEKVLSELNAEAESCDPLQKELILKAIKIK